MHLESSLRRNYRIPQSLPISLEKCCSRAQDAEREAARWGTAEVKAGSATVKTKGDVLPDGLAQLSVLGSDETGTGDFFGPVTVAACFVRADQVELVRELGVKDSKM